MKDNNKNYEIIVIEGYLDEDNNIITKENIENWVVYNITELTENSLSIIKSK